MDANGADPAARVTIYDVAAEVGVSPSTVSRAFARPGRVSSATARKVHEAAERLGYRSEQPHRMSADPRTRVIALAVSDITNPFYFGIIRGAERAAADHDFSLMVADARESAQEERRMLARHLPQVDGLLVTSSRLSDTELRGMARTVPVVVLNRQVAGLPSVFPDNARGIRRSVEHLAELGHRRVGYLAGPEASWADGARWRAVREACHELSLTDVRVGPVRPTLAGGRSAAADVLDRRLTAVIGYNDLVAVGLMRELAERGVDVPGEVSLVGFDNTLAAELVSPGLTTVGQPVTALGETAARQVIALVGGAPARQLTSVLPVELVVRASTGPSPSGRTR
ncbi:LacI family DNA-binding transcriptional regulator [Serinicoccus hydrothermalis]|uniref:LacI family DNA-binding transcriptional regulator n=1 Tax=Serinicoccus hydrothermalis TaxID=1758689 RepID=UPI0008318F76|nr:LacI family DNA-binding transcriptional regulator [Serinicoccus hydrothermalis]